MLAIELKNCVIYDEREHEINGLITMKNYRGRVYIYFDKYDSSIKNADPIKLINAIEFGVVNHVVRFDTDNMVYKRLLPNNVLINYYGNTDDYEIKKKYVITEHDINKIKKWHNIIIQWTEKCKSGKPFECWDMAYNRYLSDSRDVYIESRFLNIGLIMECILINDNEKISSNLRKRAAALCADNQQEFEKIYKIVKYGYQCRCDVSHGNVDNVLRKFGNESIYEKYFEIREITNNLLMLSFDQSKDNIIAKADNILNKYDMSFTNRQH